MQRVARVRQRRPILVILDAGSGSDVATARASIKIRFCWPLLADVSTAVRRDNIQTQFVTRSRFAFTRTRG